jgi:hypothetical protein
MRAPVGIAALLLTLPPAATAVAQQPPRMAQQPPSIDDLPPLPPPTLPRGGVKARFRVVVEGDGTASREASADGSNGACQVTTRTESSEEYEYGRGRGLEVVFTRIRRRRTTTVFLTRAGRRTLGAVFNVRGWYRVTASGQASRSGDPPEVCQPTTEKVGDETDCNRRLPAAVNVGLFYTGGQLRLEAQGERTRLPRCGSNSIETLSQAPLFGWAGFPETEREPLPASRIFGRKRAFLVVLVSGEARTQTDSPIPQFPGRALDTGQQRVIVRFIRLGGR